MRRAAVLAVLLLSACSSSPRRGLVPAGDLPAGWTVHETDHYQILTDAPASAAARLGRKLERILALYQDFLPTGRVLPRFPVKFFRSYEDYVAYGGERGSGGYYDERHAELVATRFENFTVEVDAPARPGMEAGKRVVRVAMPQEKVDASLYHEAWHQYLHWYLDTDAEIPVWFDEGMADYFGQARDEGGRFRLGAVHEEWLENIAAAVREGRQVPLAEFLKLSRAEYYEEPLLCYAEGWAFAHFLLHSGDARLLAVPERLLQAFRRDEDPEAALAAAFAGVEPAAMEEAWKAYVARLAEKAK